MKIKNKNYTHYTDKRPNCVGDIYKKDENETLEECINCWWRPSCIIVAETQNK